MEYYIYALGLFFFAKIVASFVTYDMAVGKSLFPIANTIWQIILVLPLAGRILEWW